MYWDIVFVTGLLMYYYFEGVTEHLSIGVGSHQGIQAVDVGMYHLKRVFEESGILIGLIAGMNMGWHGWYSVMLFAGCIMVGKALYEISHTVHGRRGGWRDLWVKKYDYKIGGISINMRRYSRVMYSLCFVIGWILIIGGCRGI